MSTKKLTVVQAHDRDLLPVVRAGRFRQGVAAALPCLALSRVWRRIMQSRGHGLLQQHRSSVRQGLNLSSLKTRVGPHLLALPACL